MIDLDLPGNELFRLLLAEVESPSILEMGTLRWESAVSTHHKRWAPDAEWTLADISPGLDVDVVTDAHDLDEFETDQFDAYIADAVYEHLERPWLAAMAAGRVVKKGGLAYINAPQTFPVHGYPNDFFRFSDQAMSLIFKDAGFKILYAGYAEPCKITPPPELAQIWNYAAEAWLTTEVVGQRRC